jgi:hypothetical protein
MDRKCSKIWFFQNEEIECFVDKFLTIDQIMLKHKIQNMQIHQHKRMCRKTTLNNLSISISETTNETHKNIITFRRRKLYIKTS